MPPQEKELKDGGQNLELALALDLARVSNPIPNQTGNLSTGDLALISKVLTKAQEHLSSAKKVEIDVKSQIKEMKEKVDKLENQLAEKDKALKMMSEKIEKLEMENGHLQENVEVAHIAIARNLDKIRKLRGQK